MIVDRRRHILSLHVGDRFRFRPGGPAFVIVEGPDASFYVMREGPGWNPVHPLEFEG